jgi:hypothetical protein
MTMPPALGCICIAPVSVFTVSCSSTMPAAGLLPPVMVTSWSVVLRRVPNAAVIGSMPAMASSVALTQPSSSTTAPAPWVVSAVVDDELDAVAPVGVGVSCPQAVRVKTRVAAAPRVRARLIERVVLDMRSPGTGVRDHTRGEGVSAWPTPSRSRLR